MSPMTVIFVLALGLNARLNRLPRLVVHRLGGECEAGGVGDTYCVSLLVLAVYVDDAVLHFQCRLLLRAF